MLGPVNNATTTIEREKLNDGETPTTRDHEDLELIEPLEWKALDNRLKPSIIEAHKLELKELPNHLEYAFLQEDGQLPIVISSSLSAQEKAKLIEVLKNHKEARAWSIADIKGMNSSFCTHKILMEDEYKPIVQSQRHVNPNIKEVVKKEVIKLLDAGVKEGGNSEVLLEDLELRDMFWLPLLMLGYQRTGIGTETDIMRLQVDHSGSGVVAMDEGQKANTGV
ncbi:hypothetical protein Tco_0972814 [Tanacetum coccineum]